MTISDITKAGIRGGIPNVTAQNVLIGVVDDFTDHITAKTGVFAGATFVVGSAHTDTVNVAVQLVDEDGNALTVPTTVTVLLFLDAAGAAFNTFSLTTALDAGTAGTLAVLSADTGAVSSVVSEADGTFDIDIKYTTGAKDMYAAVVLPDGKIVVSTTKIEFTA